jgi:hypothetical protein
MIYGVGDYLDALDHCIERSEALLLLIPEDDEDAREMTLYHIAALSELRERLEASTPSTFIPVH